MATITKLPSGSFQAKIRIPGHPNQSRTFSSIAEAKTWAAEVEAPLRRANMRAKRPEQVARYTTLGEALDRYDREVLPTKSASTAESHRQRIAAIKREEIASKPFAEVELRDLLALRRTMQERGLAANTIRARIATISDVYGNAATLWDGFKGIANPCMPPSKTKSTRPKPGATSRDRRLHPGEEERLEKATLRVGTHCWAAFVIAVETAMREGEIASLGSPENSIETSVDGQPYARLRKTKTGAERFVPLSQRAMFAIAAASMEPRRGKGRGKETDLVFRGLSAHTIADQFRRAVRLAKIKDLHFHDLRHESISRFFEAGYSTEQVMLISGHETYAMLRNYSHLRKDSIIQTFARRRSLAA